MNHTFDPELRNLFSDYVRSAVNREERERSVEQRDRDCNAAAQRAEELARDLPGFNPDRDPRLSAVDAHQGPAHYFINGFAGMPIKFVNPGKDGPAAVAAFKAGVAKRREMEG